MELSEYSCKTVILHNDNLKPSIIIIHSVLMKESYENISTVSDKMDH